MLKKRLIACLVVKDRLVVQSIGFKNYLPVGKVHIAVEFLNNWGIDEIILLDIEASRQGREPDYGLISEAAGAGFVPLTVGGGLRSVADMRRVLQAGADKIAINHAALARPDLVQEAAAIFGSQCLVVSVDVKQDNQGNYEVFSHLAGKPTGLCPLACARQAERMGAGEILLNSVDRDGSKQGYDLELVRQVADAVRLPVIVLGGVGHPRHLLEGLEIDNVSAVAAANFFHFTEHSVITAKAYLKSAGNNLRLDTYAGYRECGFESNGRIAKKPEEHLAELFFEYIPKEII
jgi:cyclase